MSDATASYERAIANFKKVTAGLTEADLDKQSPCASWKVRDVFDHLVAGADFFVPSAGGTVGGPIEGDPQARFDAASQQILDAFNEPGALEKMVDLPFGTMPASVLVGIATTDTFTHAWDVAKATGQSTDLDPEFAAELLTRAQQTIPDQMRGEEGVAMFGPRQEAPEGASVADQLAAFLGRKV